MKTDIEYAAMVAGLTGLGLTWSEQNSALTDYEGFWFDPLHDDGDSRRLEAASLNFIRENTERVTDAVSDAESHLICTRYENNLQAFREAVFALAVAIGKEGGE